ncbi:hypothetical protein CRV12_02805 [Candidatus Pantoea edessiphila]|uniref:S-ribosylhomocysteine lyase n=1 Tax=Candidatus Pantoea edessiphila TaxID=2044610 RepID=A0A2P5SZI5_9GAMM|nr:hypothetical protein CRV12_02805 [Candidatus Pantoea edessiphila]
MKLLDSFRVDHIVMNVISVCLFKVLKILNKDLIIVFDLRFCKTNTNMLTKC